jgi:hypothetical protein
MDTKKPIKPPKLFICECCDFKCINKKDFNKHILTVKHKKNTERLQEDTENPLKKYICICGNEYLYRQGLTKHKKKCKIVEPDTVITDKPNNEIINLLIENNKQLQDNNTQLHDEIKEFKQLMLQLITENVEVKKSILELTKNGINNTTNNNTFNLNFFLNDTCKDAMNLSDFINSIQLTYLDFIKVGCEGYVKGISNIINNNMKKLAEIERPIHCTDEKRGTIYIKDADKWEKDDDENKKLNLLIGKVATKNAREMVPYRKEFPDCTKSSSKHSDTYNKCLVEAMGGPGDDEDQKKEKIKRSILKTVLIKSK